MAFETSERHHKVGRRPGVNDAAGSVTVNGEPEARRGRQLHPGDVVRAAGDELRIVGS